MIAGNDEADRFRQPRTASAAAVCRGGWGYLCLLIVRNCYLLQQAQLARLRKEAQTEEYENRHADRFRRIFPIEDKLRQQGYTDLLVGAFSTFMDGRAGSLHRDIQNQYKNPLRVR